MERIWRRLIAVAVIGMVLALPAAASGAGQALPPTPQGGGLNAVQCWAAGHCLAVGGSARGVLVDRLSGTRWSIVAAPNPAGRGGETPTLNGLSCIGSRWCLAVGSNRCGGPAAERWNGHRWSLVNVDLPACKIGFTDVSCASRSFCMAVDSDATATDGAVTWNGTTWLDAAIPPVPTGDGATDFVGVSCAARDACAGVGYWNYGFNSTVGWWNGDDWVLDQLDDNDGTPTGGMLSASCPSVTFCMAVGNQISGDENSDIGKAIAWNGSRWGRLAFPSPLMDAVAVSCRSRADCVAVDATGESSVGNAINATSVATFNGRDWTTTASALRAYPTAISCPVIGWCMVVGILLNPKTGNPLTPAAASVR
jgi:hypothetical protein